MEMLPLAFVCGWACGANAWGTVLLLGLLGRFAGFVVIPDSLQRTDVLVVAAVLALLGIIADKVTGVDAVLDTLGTIVRPAAGAVIGVLLGGGEPVVTIIVLAVVGGLTALLSHLVRASLRLLVAQSPETASTIGTSVAIDIAAAVAVVGVLLHPTVATIAVAVALAGGVAGAVVLRHRVARGLRRYRSRVADGRDTVLRRFRHSGAGRG